MEIHLLTFFEKQISSVYFIRQELSLHKFSFLCQSDLFNSGLSKE